MEQKLPYRLVAFDLDNTILHRGAMSGAIECALRKLNSQGVVTVAATGRHISLIPNMIRRNRAIDYVICVTGSSIYEVKNRLMTNLWEMSLEQAQLAVEACKSAGGRLNLVTGARALAEKAAFRSFLKSSAVSGQTRAKPSIRQVLRLLKMYFASSLIDDAADYLLAHPEASVAKIDAFFDRESETAAAVAELNRCGCFEIAESGNYLEITAMDCTKGNALARLCEWIGLTMSDVIAFGDSGNDLSMADHAGMFVAMGNAERDVLQRAGMIAPSVQDDGFAAVVETLYGAC